MPAIDYNFIVEQGSDFNLNFQYNDENNNPIDLSNKCVVLQIKPDGGDYIYTFSSQQPVTYDTYGYSLTSSDNGLINFKLSAGYTDSEFTFDTAVYDLDIISDTTILKNIRLANGIVTIKKRNISLLNFCPAGDNPKTPVVTPVPTGSTSPTVTPTPTGVVFEDLCSATDCLNTDIYSVVYYGSGLTVNDNAISGYLTTSDTRIIENIELVIDKLKHSSPQDLQLFLAPPSGNKILLSANHKIPNYNSNGFSFMFSNKASPSCYLHNVVNGDLCNIYDKTNIVKYSNETLLNSFDHLFNHSLTGNWNLIIRDTDPLSSGSIDSWKLVVTYSPE